MLKSLHDSTKLGNALVALFGSQRRMIEDDGIEASKLAVALGAHPSKICRLIVASDESRPGFQEIREPDFQECTIADGVVLREVGQASAGQVSDCPMIVLRDPRTEAYVFYHGGRPALTPFCKEHSPTCDFTVVENALSALCGNQSKEPVEALIVGNICGSCFKHDHASAQEKATRFFPLGDKVFADLETLSLDLEAVIRHRLVHAGVREKNIRHMGPCTFETPSLASHRRGDSGDVRNTVVIVLQ